MRKKKPPRPYSRMRTIVQRCFPWSYGEDYLPAFFATRNEGMSQGTLHYISMPGIWDRKLSFMSSAEARVCVHLVYQPHFLEALENRPCMTLPGIAILDGHPLLREQVLPWSCGTVELARQLGINHPMVSDDRELDEIQATGRIRDFWPFISDTLALFRHGNAVNAIALFIKKSLNDLKLSKRKEELFLVERAYYAEARISTVKICEEDLDPFVTNNLVRLCKIAAKLNSSSISDEQLTKALLYMEERVFSSAPCSWETHLREELGLLPADVFRIFHYGVFRRHLKVDLKESVAMDRVHKREAINIASEFAGRFLEPMR